MIKKVDDVLSRGLHQLKNLKVAVEDSKYIQESALESYEIKKDLFQKDG